MDTFTQTGSVSFAKKLQQAFLAPLGGLILIGAGWFITGEGLNNFLAWAGGIKFVSSNAVSIPSDKISQENDKDLVHISGAVNTGETLGDEFVAVEKAINLKRKVETFQWTEDKTEVSKDNAGGSSTSKTTIKYEKSWNHDLINSDKFKHRDGHQNPKVAKIENKNFYAKAAKLGVFEFCEKGIKQVPSKPMLLSKEIPNYKIINETFYFSGKDYANPSIGDIRISYEFAPSPTLVTVVAQQSGNAIVPYPYDDHALCSVSAGEKTLEQCIELAKNYAGKTFWVMQIFALILIWIGLFLLIQPIIVFTRLIPIVKNLTSAIAIAVLFPLAILIQAVMIGVAWFISSPRFAAAFLTLASIAALGASLFFIWKKLKKFR